ncbi:MAG: hypothetical protein LC775_01425 [Acidobacteria bacterium]|nr:hypothetical protein [Acidobacteriota bacterium]
MPAGGLRCCSFLPAQRISEASRQGVALTNAMAGSSPRPWVPSTSTGSRAGGYGDVKRDDDRTLIDELGCISEALGPFVFGILSDTLSVSEQLAFGHQLIALGGRIRARVERQADSQRVQARDASPAGDGEAL